MKRALLFFRLAFEAIVGVLLLLNVPLKIYQYFMLKQPGTTVGTLIGTVVGTALVWDAFRLRRLFSKIDSQCLPGTEDQESK
jgi:translation initiation factor 2 gamma subunit (eIF-2gamma)